MSETPDQRPASDAMDRRTFVRFGAVGGALLAAGAGETSNREPGSTVQTAEFELEEASIRELRSWMEEGRHTARSLAELYIERIERLDRSGPTLRQVLEVNPDALEIARELDRERREGRIRGPLHGIPVLLKDNFDTGDRMMTSAGSLALYGPPAPRDSEVAARLRRAGALILGKTTPSGRTSAPPTPPPDGAAGAAKGRTRSPWTGTPAALRPGAGRRSRPTLPPWGWGPKPTDPWSARPTPTDSWASSRAWAW